MKMGTSTLHTYSSSLFCTFQADIAQECRRRLNLLSHFQEQTHSFTSGAEFSLSSNCEIRGKVWIEEPKVNARLDGKAEDLAVAEDVDEIQYVATTDKCFPFKLFADRVKCCCVGGGVVHDKLHGLTAAAVDEISGQIRGVIPAKFVDELSAVDSSDGEPVNGMVVLEIDWAAVIAVPK